MSGVPERRLQAGVEAFGGDVSGSGRREYLRLRVYWASAPGYSPIPYENPT
jgi:hypothetical protein